MSSSNELINSLLARDIGVTQVGSSNNQAVIYTEDQIYAKLSIFTVDGQATTYLPSWWGQYYSLSYIFDGDNQGGWLTFNSPRGVGIEYVIYDKNGSLIEQTSIGTSYTVTSDRAAGYIGNNKVAVALSDYLYIYENGVKLSEQELTPVTEGRSFFEYRMITGSDYFYLSYADLRGIKITKYSNQDSPDVLSEIILPINSFNGSLLESDGDSGLYVIITENEKTFVSHFSKDGQLIATDDIAATQVRIFDSEVTIDGSLVVTFGGPNSAEKYYVWDGESDGNVKTLSASEAVDNLNIQSNGKIALEPSSEQEDLIITSFTSGNDKFRLSGSGETVDAGSGIDMAIYSTQKSNITKTSNGYSVNGDTLINIERIQFEDADIALDTDGATSAGGIYRLYKATFNREPDTVGLGYWIAQADGDFKDAVRMAEDFTWSEEFQSLYNITTTDNYGTGTDVSELVTGFYENVLGRAPDVSGLNYYTDVIESHEKTVGRVLAEISDSPENYDNTIELIQNGIQYDLWLG